MESLSERGGPGPFEAGAPLGPPGSPGSRYRTGEELGSGPYGRIYSAVDDAGRPVLVRRLHRDLVATSEDRRRVAAEIARAASLEHEAIVKPLDCFAVDDDLVVVSPAIKGQSLRAFLSSRAEPLPFADAAGLILGICSALTHAAPLTFHGGLIASNVIVQTGGRVKVAAFGLARALPLAAARLEPPDRPALAPELPGSADARSDVYALGALLFELTCGRAPAPGLLPRQILPRLPADLDPLISVLLAPAPEDRLTDAAAVAGALGKLISAEQTEARRLREHAAARVSRELTAARAADDRSRRPSKVRITENEPRWLIHKGKLDYGPFSLAQLKQQIIAHELLPGDIVIDQELGKRAEVDAHPLLHSLVAEAARVRVAHGEAAVVASDKKRGAALYAVIALGALTLLGGGLALFRVLDGGAASSTHQKDRAIEVANVDGIKVSTARHTDDRDAQRKHHAAGAPGPRAPGKADTWDDSTSFDLGGEGVGDERLDDGQIDAVLRRDAEALARCLRAEAERGGARRADIEFIVLGSGRVTQARVNGESGSALAGCLRGAMQALQFPSFNGPRTKASFSMSL